jgi:hypothetical protein
MIGFIARIDDIKGSNKDLLGRAKGDPDISPAIVPED